LIYLIYYVILYLTNMGNVCKRCFNINVNEEPLINNNNDIYTNQHYIDQRADDKYETGIHKVDSNRSSRDIFATHK
jgi:hypothetical protein